MNNPGPLFFLVGMPGAGKSFWGRALSAHLQYPFIDLDVFIGEQEQASIASLFGRLGEQGFRKLEHEYLQRLVATAQPHTIIATGGGAPCFYGNMDLMKSVGQVIYLQAGIPWLLINLRKEGPERPLLQGKEDLSQILRNMLNAREIVYLQAHHIVDATTVSLTIFEQTIFSCINRP